MDKRTFGPCLLAFGIGVLVWIDESALVLYSHLSWMPVISPQTSQGSLQLQSLKLSLLMVYAVPSFLGAVLIALLRPRRWALYSACAVVPGAAVAIYQTFKVAGWGYAIGYPLMRDLVQLTALPACLWLLYAVIRRHEGSMKLSLPGGHSTAALSVAAAAAGFLSMYWLSGLFSAGPGPAILSAVLALSFARRRAEGASHAWNWELGGILVVGVAAAGVAWLLHAYFAVGAAVFTAALFLSVWLRRFGGRRRQLGRVMALPFIGLLVAPGAPHSLDGPGVDLLLVLLAGVAAFAFDRLALLLEPPAAPNQEPPARQAEQGLFSNSTRMAAQMGVALASAFFCGRLLFHHHWSWVVITAFIVCSGAIGRGDAAYKGVLRLVGAAFGVIVATALQYVTLPQGPETVVLVFAVLYVGMWLRDVSYAWWAACVTVILALLLPVEGVSVTVLLGERLAAIFVGAVCGVAACWFVLPIKTRSVVRRRVADALLALEELASATDTEREQKRLAFEAAVEECARVAPPMEWHRRLTRARPDAEHPGVWLGIVESLAPPAAVQPEVVKAVRLSRKALKEDQGLTPALRNVEASLKP